MTSLQYQTPCNYKAHLNWVFDKKNKVNCLALVLFFSRKINRYCHHTLYQQDSSSNDIVILNCTHTVSSSIYYIDQTFFKYMYISTVSCSMVLLVFSGIMSFITFSCLKIVCMNINAWEWACYLLIHLEYSLGNMQHDLYFALKDASSMQVLFQYLAHRYLKVVAFCIPRYIIFATLDHILV